MWRPICMILTINNDINIQNMYAQRHTMYRKRIDNEINIKILRLNKGQNNLGISYRTCSLDPFLKQYNPLGKCSFSVSIT